MHKGKSLIVCCFDSPKNPLNSLLNTPHLDYIQCYLRGLDVKTAVIEQNYFDRDYLDEFSAFYSKSAHGYSNICKRVHFFSGEFSSRLTNSALNGISGSLHRLQAGYLGFVVLRPLETAPFGRTVLKWYENRDVGSERITPLLRSYTCCVAGVELHVKGMPWQQQDRGVAACATIALWSMFHSSAFDANHSVPTTAEITKNAHNGAAGVRAFPSNGLSIHQIQEAIFSQKLAPNVYGSTHTHATNSQIRGFSKDYLASTCAANIRSGYPVLLIGDYIHEQFTQQHMICAIGFREKAQSSKEPGTYTTMDDETEIFYVHDDNIGPNVRCELSEEDGLAVLVTSPPDYLGAGQVCPRKSMSFRPSIIIFAVHDEIRTDADSFAQNGKRIAAEVSQILNPVYVSSGLSEPAISYNTQFLNVKHFYKSYLEKVFSGSGKILGNVRRALIGRAPPLSLHVGLVSLGLCDESVSRLIDVIYDTTDSDRTRPVIAHIIYDKKFKEILDLFPKENVKRAFGVQIIGYE